MTSLCYEVALIEFVLENSFVYFLIPCLIQVFILIFYREFTHIDESGLYDIKIEKCFGMIVYVNEQLNDTTHDSSTDTSDANTS